MGGDYSSGSETTKPKRLILKATRLVPNVNHSDYSDGEPGIIRGR